MGLKLTDFFKGTDSDNQVSEDYYNISNEDALKSSSSEGAKLILLEPRAYSESQQIADHLKNRHTVVVNLKRVTKDQTKRIVDFLSGCIYAIGGDMQKIGPGIFVCAPNNINVQGKITNESDELKGKENEDTDW